MVVANIPAHVAGYVLGIVQDEPATTVFAQKIDAHSLLVLDHRYIIVNTIMCVLVLIDINVTYACMHE